MSKLLSLALAALLSGAAPFVSAKEGGAAVASSLVFSDDWLLVPFIRTNAGLRVCPPGVAPSRFHPNSKCSDQAAPVTAEQYLSAACPQARLVNLSVVTRPKRYSYYLALGYATLTPCKTPEHAELPES
jgi:hypothetical protein